MKSNSLSKALTAEEIGNIWTQADYACSIRNKGGKYPIGKAVYDKLPPKVALEIQGTDRDMSSETDIKKTYKKLWSLVYASKLSKKEVLGAAKYLIEYFKLDNQVSDDISPVEVIEMYFNITTKAIYNKQIELPFRLHLMWEMFAILERSFNMVFDEGYCYEVE